MNIAVTGAGYVGLSMKPLTRQETRDYLEVKSKLAEPSWDFATPMRCRPSRTLSRGPSLNLYLLGHKQFKK